MSTISSVSTAAATTTTSTSKSSTEIASETRVTNADGSVTTTIVYEDGTTKETTTAPNPAKASSVTERMKDTMDALKEDTRSETSIFLTV